MPALYCDHGDTRDVACGLNEPLSFEDGHANVADPDVAAGIVARHTHIHHARTHPDADPVSAAETGGSDAEDGSAEVCGAEMSDGSTCERPADGCPYHD